MKIKKLMRGLLVAVLTMACGSAAAQTFTYNDLDYEVLSVEDKTCQKIQQMQYPGGFDAVLDAHPVYNGEEYTLVSLGERALSTSNLTSVEIPNTVTSIGFGAFHGCRRLTSLEIPNSVTSIEDWAFGYSGITSIKLSNSLTAIPDSAFYGAQLTSIEIPTSVTSIGSDAFYYLSLKHISEPTRRS